MHAPRPVRTHSTRHMHSPHPRYAVRGCTGWRESPPFTGHQLPHAAIPIRLLLGATSPWVPLEGFPTNAHRGSPAATWCAPASPCVAAGRIFHKHFFRVYEFFLFSGVFQFFLVFSRLLLFCFFFAIFYIYFCFWFLCFFGVLFE